MLASTKAEMEKFKMDPVTAIVIAILVGVGAGIGTGVGISGAAHSKATARAIEAQADNIEALQSGQAVILENATKPIVIDAEIRSTLADVPVQCRTEVGGDPTTVECQWATCIQYGQSSANRPECREVEQLMIEKLKEVACPEIVIGDDEGE
jgi:hypothetical protein